MLSLASEILKKTFGYSEFRLLQSDVIESVLKKNDSLVIMPTGGGKSLCYQIPALVFTGITIVVSPLISLMKDQVEQLNQLGIAANYLNSSLSPSQYETNFSDIRSGKIKLVYLAPETLLQDRILHLLLQDLSIDCITIDEAHCISEWGHDFRPEYRQIATIRKKFSNAVCVALTATATPEVRQDIIRSLELSESKVFIDSFNRPNLYLHIEPKVNANQQTIEFVNKKKGQSGIIYCFSRAQVDELTLLLQNKGIKALPYHAGLSDKERNFNQDAFIKDDIDVIVATIAFGMGINKPDVRYVIHYDLPKNIESYYQQIGRAGRDGLPSDCYLLYSYGDSRKVEYFIQQKEGLEKEIAEKQLKQILSYAESYQCRRFDLLHYFGESYSKIPCNNCDNCLTKLDESHDLTIPAQKYLSCVARTNQLYGNTYLSDILLGSKAQKIISNGHDQLSTYGIGKEYTKKQWKQLAELLIRKQILLKDSEFGSLKLTTNAQPILKGKEKFWGYIEEELKDSSHKKKNEIQKSYMNYDEQLFQELKNLRKKIATGKGIPPYVIFHDTSLIEMSKVFPTSKTALLSITGIGLVKAETYGEAFVSLINDYINRTGKSSILKQKPTKSIQSKLKPKNVEVSELFNSGKTIHEISELLENSEDTVIKHLSKYSENGDYLNKEYIRREMDITDNELELIAAVLKSTPNLLLKPVFNHFDEKYPYKLLHLMRLYLTNQTNLNSQYI